MRRMIMLLGFVFCLLPIAVQAAEEMDKAEHLVHICRAVKDDSSGLLRGEDFNAGYCLGLFSGIGQLSGTYVLIDGKFQQTFCFPSKDMSTGQVVKIFLKYADDHPERLHIDRNFLIYEAFSQVFPCKDRKP